MKRNEHPGWLLMPSPSEGAVSDAEQTQLDAMLTAMNLEAPPQLQKAGLDQPPLSSAERYLLKLPVETSPFPLAPETPDLFDMKSEEDVAPRDWFVRVDDAFGPSVNLEMEMAADRSGARHGARKGIFWLTGGGEKIVYAWDGKSITLAQPTPVEDGSSLVYDPDADNLFIVSDNEERLYVFTVGRREKE